MDTSMARRGFLGGFGVRNKLIVLLALMALAPLAALWGFLLLETPKVQKALSKEVGAVARELNELVDRNLFERYGDVQAFAQNQAARDRAGWGKAGSPLVGSMNGYTTGYGIYKLMMLVAPDGKVLAVNSVSPAGNPIDTAPLYNANFKNAAWLKDAVAGNFLKGQTGLTGTVVADPFFSAEVARLYNDDGFVIPFSTPVKDASGATVAVWVNFADFGLVEEIFASIHAGMKEEGLVNADLTLLDKQGRVLVDLDPIRLKLANARDYKRDRKIVQQLNLAEDGVEAAKLAVAGGHGSMISRSLRKNIDQAAGYHHSVGALGYPGLGWSALARVPNEEAFAIWDEVMGGVLLCIGVTMLVATALGAVIGVFAARPLQALAGTIERLSSGDAAIDIKGDKRGDEIGALWRGMSSLRATIDEAFRARQMLDQMPINVMMADPEDFTITYVNKTSLETLKSIQKLLPCKAEEIVGQCIDIFHKNPAHQRKILANPKNLPHRAQIQLGDEYLELNVAPITDAKGNYAGPMVSWSIVTDKVKSDAETARLMTMVDEMPINVMAADAKDFRINYVNKTSLDTLKKIEHLLPCKAADIKGQCIDIFHKHPEHQRRLLASPDNLPHSAKIKLGEETLSLKVSAIRDKQGTYLGPMVSWAVVTGQVKLADDFEANVKGVVDTVSASATEMQTTAQAMSATAEETNRQSTAVAAASEQATNNVQTVASAAEELSTSVQEISNQVAQSTKIARTAVDKATGTNAQIQELATAAQKIDEVVKLISDIAAQTNLLALNATIEAARAGDAGKGFAVVASEVKGLANQTAQATGEIAAQIAAVQSATTNAVSAIGEITKVISEINEISAAVAAAVEEQGAATQEIARNVQEAAAGTREVSSNIGGVTQAASETGASAQQVLEAAGELSRQSEGLAGEVDKFLRQVRAM